MIRNYAEFVEALLAAGFSMGGKDKGIYALIPYDWKEQEFLDVPVKWHTGDPETDPWEWRMRVLDERKDIAYGKVFFRVSGYITRAWYPCFLAVRRGGADVETAYAAGKLSQTARDIYALIRDNGVLPLHIIKELGGFGKTDKARFDRALVELQMGLFITMCGRQVKRSKKGEEYGWASTAFCTTEDFWGTEVFAEAAALSGEEAYQRIAAQVLKLNPAAAEKDKQRFITG